MASSSDDSEEDNFVVLGTPVPELLEGETQKKPTTIQDLTARDKQGRRRFHGAFTGGFSAGYFNTVGTKEGFTPSTFLSSRSQKGERSEARPEDFMDEEDFDEHGIAPRKFSTVGSFTSEERKRKLHDDTRQLTVSSNVNLVPSLTDLIVPEQLPIGIKILRKMGWREGYGLGPRVKKKKKRKVTSVNMSSTMSDSASKVYGCAPPPPTDEGESDSDDFLPENMSDITFAPKDVCPISMEIKDNIHGLGYKGLDPGLALPSSHLNLFDSQPVRSQKGGRGIQGQAFGVGAFEDEDEDIYGVDNMSNYDITMRADEDEGDGKFGWTAPRQHRKQVVPVSYVGKLLEGFKLSAQVLKLKKKFSPPILPRLFKPQHWFRKRRETSHLPTSLTTEDPSATQKKKMTAVDRGLMLGETPIMSSVFDLVTKEDKNRIAATKEAIAITASLSSKKGADLANRFQPAQMAPAIETVGQASHPSSGQLDSFTTADAYLAKFIPADLTPVKSVQEVGVTSKAAGWPVQASLFQGNLSFQPFRKDAAKQARYDAYLTSLKQGSNDPYSSVESGHMTEWEKSRERDEFSKAAKIYRPMSAMMSSRFVRGAMIDDDRVEAPLDSENEKSDEAKAADMKMFGKLTREEFEWHPDKLLCRRFNVPNPYPESDVVGLLTVKRDKYSVFNFLNFADYQSGEVQEPSDTKTETSKLVSQQKTMKPAPSRKTAMASIFKVLDDPDFHKLVPRPTEPMEQGSQNEKETDKKEENEEVNDTSETQSDKDLFRAIFKNSDSESSSEESAENKQEEAITDEEENDRSSNKGSHSFREGDQTDASKTEPEMTNVNKGVQVLNNINMSFSSSKLLPSTPVLESEVISKRSRSRWGEKSIFSVLDDLDKDGASVDSQHTSDDKSKTQTEASRLSSQSSVQDEDDAGGEYGPALSSTPVATFSKTTDTASKADNSRHKEHSHRKKKKEKSKHKKGKKHKKHKKSSKSRKSRKEKKSSGSEADTESSDDVSDNELLQRWKQVSKDVLVSGILKKI